MNMEKSKEKSDLSGTQSIALLTDKCNQSCVFCSGTERFCGAGLKATDPDSIKALIRQEKNSICFEGGEPTLCPDLLRYLALARDQGIRDRILVTNGVRLCYKEYCRQLLEAGVTVFSISFPHSEQERSDAITRTPGFYQKRMQGIRNLIELGAGRKIRLTYVVSRVNHSDIYNFVRLVGEEFQDIFYIEINYVKVLGEVARRPRILIPLVQVQPYLLKALRYCLKHNIAFILDNWPLCLIPGFERYSIDTHFLALSQGNPFSGEKAHIPACKSCSLERICTGPRQDYIDFYGGNEIKPVKTDPRPIIKAIRNKE